MKTIRQTVNVPGSRAILADWPTVVSCVVSRFSARMAVHLSHTDGSDAVTLKKVYFMSRERASDGKHCTESFERSQSSPTPDRLIGTIKPIT